MTELSRAVKEASHEGQATNAVALDSTALSSIRTVVDKVNIDGVARTKDETLRRECQRIFQSETFEDLIVNVDFTIKEFQRMGLFNAVGALIDVGNGKQAENYEVSFFVKEPNRLFGAIQTTVSGSGDTGLNLSLETPNVFGSGERFRLEQGFGTKTKSHFSLSFTKPIQLSAVKSLSASLFRRNFLLDANGLLNIDHGVALDVNTWLASSIRHRLGWEGSWRFIHSQSPKTPYDIRQFSGHSLKSAIINEIAKDTRDHPVLAEEGYLLRLLHELAGLGGDIRHSKQEANVQINIPFLAGISAQGTFSVGFIQSLALNSATTGIADRYFLGGLNLRGFMQNHVGPHSKDFASGGEAFWTSGLHLYSPLPFTNPYHALLRHIRLHGFFNMGNITGREALRELFVDFPCSVGGGVVVALGRLARLEINFTHILRASESHVRAGVLSFGLGVNHS